MSLRIASWNVENLFSRVRAMNEWSDGRDILQEYRQLNILLQKPTYTTADKTAIKDCLERLGLQRSEDSRWEILRQNRGRPLKRPKSGGMTITAAGEPTGSGAASSSVRR